MTAFTTLVVQHEPFAGLGQIGERIAAAGGAIDLRGPDTVAGAARVPEQVGAADGLIVLGGMPGPTDDEIAPWLVATRALIGDALANELPLLGICLGAQLLATVVGGNVTPITAAAGPEIGLTPIELTAAGHRDPLFAGLEAELQAVQWHGLSINNLPAEVNLLATNDRCPTQAFRVGPEAWGTQFHFEALSSDFAVWVKEGEETLAELGRDGAAELAKIEAAERRLKASWSIVADRWIERCRAHARERVRGTRMRTRAG